MSYGIEEARNLVIKAGLELVNQGLIARTWGNISARISDSEFVITPSGRTYDSLTPDDLVTVKISDLSYTGKIKPSSEKGVHAAAYRNRPDINFVIHTHQAYASALSVLDGKFNVAYSDRKVLGPKVPTAEYGRNATKRLISNVETRIRNHPDCNTVLMRNHGALCLGRSYDDAFRAARTLEAASRKQYIKLTREDYPAECYSDHGISYYEKIFRRDEEDEMNEHSLMFENKNVNCVVVLSSPFVKMISGSGRPMRAYIDDMAQFCGASIPTVRYRKDHEAMEKSVKRSLHGTNSAVLIQGRGALITASDTDEADALAFVLEKNAMAALLGRRYADAEPVELQSAVYEHFLYLSSYSRLKNKNK